MKNLLVLNVILLRPIMTMEELKTGQTTIAFAAIQLAQSNIKDGFIESKLTQKPFAVELGLVTEDVDEVIKLAQKNGAVIVAHPKKKPWGQTVAYIRDTEGFLIEICTPIH